MKKNIKRLAIFLVCLSAIQLSPVAVNAEPCPLPEVNTDAEILFSGFDWYTDYNDTVTVANQKGMTNPWKSFNDDMCTTPHWATVYNSINGFAGSETGCGGYITYRGEIPNVAGYKIDALHLYLMRDIANIAAEDYTQDGALQFYMAVYEFDVTDKEATYNDLLEKLKGLYGENPYLDSYGLISSTPYAVWVNEEKACIALSHDEYRVALVYMAPGAEEKLCQVEEAVKNHKIEQEKASAANDVTGL